MHRPSLKWLWILGVCFTISGCAPFSPGNSVADRTSAPVSVLYAGSMTKVMEDSIRTDIQASAHIHFEGQGGGSRALAQMMVSGLRSPDVFISASPSVNTELLMQPSRLLAHWYIPLASDEMVIAFTPKSKFASQLEQAKQGRTPWYQVLQSPGFLLGRTDPKLDPKGVNTLFTLQLASAFYHIPGLSDAILGPFENTRQVFPEETLLSRLQTGQLDAAFAYRHEAEEWGLPYVSLPPQINLGNLAYQSTYRTAHVQVDHVTQTGGTILFTITIPSHVAHPDTAARFVQYMLTGNGHNLLMHHGYRAVPPELVGNMADVPALLKPLIQGTITKSMNGGDGA